MSIFNPKVKIKHEKPPIWDKILESGMTPDPDNIFITYGDTIYIPSGRQIPDYTIEHEKVHMKQQKEMGKDMWWERYLRDNYFRLEQELAGYARQYEFMCRTVKDRNKRSQIALDIATSLSGPTYGDLIGKMVAYNEIRKRANM